MPDHPQGHRFLEFAFLCDAASDKGGALDALGIGTTMVFARELPTLHQLTLVIRVAWAGGPAGPGAKDLEVRVVDPDGDHVARIAGEFEVADPETAFEHPDLPIGANMIFPLPIGLSKAGLHHVEISIDGDDYTPLPLKVVLVGQ